MKSELKLEIVYLEPMKVASCRATGTEPEIKAFRMMTAWAKEAEIEGSKETRFFGFDNPAPSTDGSEYGYEVWMKTASKLSGTPQVEIKNFPGGHYAVIRTLLPRIAQSWRELIAWRAESEYGQGMHQCLEEHLDLPIDNPPEAVKIDLYLPISE